MARSLLFLSLAFVLWMTAQCNNQTRIKDFLGNCSSSELNEAESISCIYNRSKNSQLQCNSIRKEEETSCLFQACHIIGNNDTSCILYNCTDSATLCEKEDSTAEGTGSDCDSSNEGVLIAFLAIFIVALLVAGCAILTLVLMVRDMKNERVQDNLPNPYSCIFTFVGSIFTTSDEDEEKGKKNKTKKEKKKKTPKTSEAPKHYRRKEKESVSEVERREESSSEDPEHDADDYEEMDAAGKRDSFLEGGPDDIYQNTD